GRGRRQSSHDKIVAGRVCGHIWRGAPGSRRPTAKTTLGLSYACRPPLVITLLDPYLVQSRHFEWVSQVQRFEGASDDARNDGVAIPFVVRRDNEPGRPFAAAALQGGLVGRHIVVPVLALGEIIGIEFPSLGG